MSNNFIILKLTSLIINILNLLTSLPICSTFQHLFVPSPYSITLPMLQNINKHRKHKNDHKTNTEITPASYDKKTNIILIHAQCASNTLTTPAWIWIHFMKKILILGSSCEYIKAGHFWKFCSRVLEINFGRDSRVSKIAFTDMTEKILHTLHDFQLPAYQCEPDSHSTQSQTTLFSPTIQNAVIPSI